MTVGWVEAKRSKCLVTELGLQWGCGTNERWKLKVLACSPGNKRGRLKFLYLEVKKGQQWVKTFVQGGSGREAKWGSPRCEGLKTPAEGTQRAGMELRGAR